MATKRILNLCAPVDGWLEASADGAAPADGKPVLRRFAMTAYTGGPMTIAGWSHPVVVDLAGLQVSAKSRPILKDHNRSLIVGHTESIGVQGSRLLVSGVISGAGPVAREIVDSSRNGFPWQASLGAVANPGAMEFVAKGRTAAANGQQFEGPVHIARRSVLGEVSFVALGADDNTSANGAAAAIKEDDMTFDQWLAAKGFDPASLSDTQKTSLQAMFDASGQEPKPGTAPDDAPSSVGDSGVVARIRAETAAETKRIGDVRKVCSVGGGKHSDLEAKAIAEGWDVTRTELEVLRADRPVYTGVRRDSDAGQSARAVEAALCISAGLPEAQVGKWYDDKTMNAALAPDLRGAGLHTLLYETIRAGGEHVRPGRVDNETIKAAFAADRRLIQASGSGGSSFSTISLSGILSNVANKTMLAAYTAVESVVAMFCAETDVNDFKEVTRYRLTGTGVFEKVGPDGELKHAGLSEQAYTNKVETYGRMIALTRQMMINDDLGAFLQIPRIIGRMSALKREEAVFELLLSNPATFFSVGNKNFISGAATNLGIDALTQGEQLFLDQTATDGKPILLSPAVLLVPSALKVTAQVLMTETRINETTTTDKGKPAANPHVGKWKPVATPYLNSQGFSGSSAKAWYLFANPADVAAMEIAYLRGKRTPTIESGDTDFNTLGMQWRGYFDFGVAMQDSRAAIKSKGEV
ncbi:MAG: hypothetical protein IT435_10880 [Phycisphaerales bacterium]|nr:hypothetical protein [Phycisphaerales bacterium]